MAEEFLNKVNSAYKKGMSTNPNFEKAAVAISIIAKGEEPVKAVKDKEDIEDVLEV